MSASRAAEPGMFERLGAATHSYVGRKACGCVVAVVVDTGDRQTARDVADFIRSGLTVERMTHDEFRALPFLSCPHGASAAELEAAGQMTLLEALS